VSLENRRTERRGAGYTGSGQRRDSVRAAYFFDAATRTAIATVRSETRVPQEVAV